MKYTIVQDSRTMEILSQHVPAGTGPGEKFGDSSEFLVIPSSDPWHLFDRNQPFTLTWSAGDTSTYAFPNCGNTWSGTLNVSSCADPKIVHTITTTATPAGGGTVTCNDGATTVTEDSDVECTATANPGHILETLEISDGVATPVTCTTSPCSLTGVKGNVTATATFAKEHEVKVSATGGSVTCSPTLPAKVKDGGTLTCTAATPDAGYEFTSLTLAGTTCTSLPCTFNITSAGTLEAKFTEISGGGGGGGGGAVTGTASPVPTLGEVGLLLSGIALAGAAAPALRRRERKGRKQD